MADLNLLDSLIKNAKARPPSEKAADEHFDQIVSYIEQEKINEAIKLIENVFSKGAPDIRIIIYYLYAHFTVNGINSFSKTFPLIKSLVNDHIEILTPKNRIDKHIQSSISWFFSQLLHKFKYHEKLHHSDKNHIFWKKHVLGNSSEDLNEIVAITRDFNQFFLEKWPLSSAKDRILHLNKKIEEIRSLVVENEKPVQKEEEPSIEEVEMPADTPLPIPTEVLEEMPKLDFIPLEEDENSEEVFEPLDSIPRDEVSTPQEMSTPSAIQEPLPLSFSISEESKEAISDSLHSFIESLDELSKKLKIFESLIEKNDYLKAAIVAKDIDHIIENFDPLSYFPKLFARYFSLFAKHVTALSEQYEKKDSLQVKALEKLYRTDSDMFMDW